MKTYLRISIIMLIPALLTMLINMLCAFLYWDHPLEVNEIQKFNHEFIYWSCLLGAFSLSFILVAQLMISPYIDKIDKLEFIKGLYADKVKELEITKQKYLELIEKNLK